MHSPLPEPEQVAVAPAPGFLVFGHRGAAGHAPENTLLALDRGIMLGADWLEFDVQLHPQGELLLFHDLRLERVSRASGDFARTPLRRLRQLRLGQDQGIPTLDEALDLIDNRAGINVEIKRAEGTGLAVADCLRRRQAMGWPAERMLVSSFHLPELREFHEAAPEIPIAVLLYGVPLDYACCAAELEPAAVHLSAEFLDLRMIADAHAHDIRVHVYTVNEPEEMLRLHALGVDGIFTDYPDRALDVLRARHGRSASVAS
jgi:Glycerophosphoryl diester phosphodiesterase